jgi:BlaI family transcriptional regulator, penicillinase repressor
MSHKSRPRHRSLGDAEQAVMDHVWSHGPVTAEACREALSASWPMKESTVRTVLRRLEDKGYVAHTVEGRAYRYRAIHAPVTVATRAVRQLIDRFCGGSAEALVMGMVDDEVLGAPELERIQRRIAQARRSRR